MNAERFFSVEMKLHHLGLIFLLFLGLSLLLTGCARVKFLDQEELNRITRRPVTEQVEKNRKDRLQIGHPTKKTTTQSNKDRKRKSAKARQKQKRNNLKELDSNSLTATTQGRTNPKPKPDKTDREKSQGNTQEQLTLSPI